MGSDEPHLPTDMRGAKTDRRSPRPLGAIVPPEYGPPMTIYNRFVRWARLPCADRRVPLLLAGLGVGELFVARNDRNMAETANGDYRIRHRAPRRSVRRRCGAVSVACEVVEQHAKFPGPINPLVNAIIPAAKGGLRQTR